jgi:hypothetical protein
MKTLNIIVISLILLIFGCSENKSNKPTENKEKSSLENDSLNKIPILNFGSFHMGFTPDENTTEFDEHDLENQRRVHEIAEKLSIFKPTVILLEIPPEYNEYLKVAYDKYVKNPKMFFEHPTEIELLAYELGRISGTKRIHGIDHQMGYNYDIGNQIENLIDSVWHDKYYEDPLKFYPQVNFNEDSLNLIDKLLLTNHDRYLDFLITLNADMLTHVGGNKGFEGADEAAKFYQRNLRMYSNLNRIELNENDRVFILMGATHTAFFRDFISRSPKYKMVNTFDYLK